MFRMCTAYEVFAVARLWVTAPVPLHPTDKSLAPAKREAPKRKAGLGALLSSDAAKAASKPL